MKNLFFVFAAVLLLSVKSFSQINKGNWEFSLSGDMGYTSTTTDYTYGTYHYTNDGESRGYFIVAVRAGYFIIDGLEIEPEYMETAVEGANPCFSISGNVLYNFKLKLPNISPFIIAGYGVGNAIPVSNLLINQETDGLNIGHWNLGAGVKFFVSNSVGIRIEYRYQKYDYDQNSYGMSGSTKVNYNKLLVGVSFFL